MGGDGADRAFTDVVVEFRPPIAEISTGLGHALWRVANGPCQPGPARKPCPKAWGVGPVARLPTHRRPAWPSPGAGQRVLRGICLWRRLRQHRDAQFVYSVSRNALSFSFWYVRDCAPAIRSALTAKAQRLPGLLRCAPVDPFREHRPNPGQSQHRRKKAPSCLPLISAGRQTA